MDERKANWSDASISLLVDFVTDGEQWAIIHGKFLQSFALLYKAREGGRGGGGEVAHCFKISMNFRPFFSVIGGDGLEMGNVFCVHFFMS